MRHATMNANPMATAARRARRERRFGLDAACVRCGITTSESLTPMKRSLLEDHQVCGQAHDEALTVPVCPNCHAILTEGQRSAGVIFDAPPALLHQLAAALASLYAMLHDLSERGMEWAHALSELITDLDTSFPAWRNLPNANAIGGAS